MPLPIYQVDAFTGTLFAGNPAAVVVCETAPAPEVMQAIALENNLSETAFVVGSGDGFQIRWFTPTVEVDLCGHATLAAAHVLFKHRGHGSATVSFASKSGVLPVRQAGELLTLDFPADNIAPVAAPDGLLGGLGATPLELYRGRDDYLAVFEHEEQIEALAPEMGELAKVPGRGVIVTAPGREVDFVSRFFGPRCGVPEDPVTGSAHTTLTPYWSKRLDKTTLRARQLSRRGGELLCTDRGARIDIGGRAVTYLVGEISL